MHWHVYFDMDAFYVSCELRERPELSGNPVIVGPDPNRGATRGVVLSASYEARAFGVRSAMPVSRAHILCPQAIWVPPDFTKYARASQELRDLLKRHDAHVVMHSIDEASIGCEADNPSDVRALARTIQSEIRSQLHLPASVGASPYLSVAKMATDLAKPEGIRVISAEETASVLAPLSVGAIPGVGPKTAERLRLLGYDTIDSLAKAGSGQLRRALGRFGEDLRALARGHPNESERDAERGPRSRSAERTGERDWTERPELLAAVRDIAQELANSVREERWLFRNVTVRFRWSDFLAGQRGRLLPGATDDAATLVQTAARLAAELWEEERGSSRGVRTISVGVARLSRRSGRQPAIELAAASAGRRIK